MDASILLLYVVAASAVMITPGPAMLLALNNGASHGMRVAGFGMAGAMLSDLILIAAVGCGLGALLQASEHLFSLVKWVGAAYLLYLAIVLWRAPVRGLGVSTPAASVSARSTFLRALLVGLSNPKGLLFFSAFLPQFIRADQPLLQQYLILAVITAALDCLMMIVYALGGRHAVRSFSARVMQWINRSCAGMLAILAVGLSLYRRNDLH